MHDGEGAFKVKKKYKLKKEKKKLLRNSSPYEGTWWTKIYPQTQNKT
jgi:hypothetical protein